MGIPRMEQCAGIVDRSADVAQLVEHQLPKLRVAGSIPVVRFVAEIRPGLGLLLEVEPIGRPDRVHRGLRRRRLCPSGRPEDAGADVAPCRPYESRGCHERERLRSRAESSTALDPSQGRPVRTGPCKPVRTYRWVEHTAELELEVEAAGEAEVFADAAAALGELLDDGSGGPAERREIVLRSAERATLLADWLEELVFLAETEDFVPERLASLELEETRLQAEVEGRSGAPPHLVKAVTYHGLELVHDGKNWRARTILDV